MDPLWVVRQAVQVMEGDVAVYVEGGAGPPPTESSKLLRNVRKRLRGNGTRQRNEAADTVELDLQRGYAFSQEEAGAVSQVLLRVWTADQRTVSG